MPNALGPRSRRGRIANTSPLGRRSRPVRGPRPHDIICHTQTLTPEEPMPQQEITPHDIQDVFIAHGRTNITSAVMYSLFHSKREWARFLRRISSNVLNTLLRGRTHHTSSSSVSKTSKSVYMESWDPWECTPEPRSYPGMAPRHAHSLQEVALERVICPSTSRLACWDKRREHPDLSQARCRTR